MDPILNSINSTSFKSDLENAYYVAGVVIAITALIGLYQLILTRRVARTSAKREAYKLAAERCEVFASDIMPFYLKFIAELKTKNITVLEKAKVEFSERGFSVNLSEVVPDDIDKLNGMEASPMALLNRFEAFALYFIIGVAADEPGFLTLGSAYCDVVKTLIPFVAMLTDDDPTYEHVIRLYFLWQTRRERRKLQMDKSRLEKQLHRKPNVTIRSIGT